MTYEEYIASLGWGRLRMAVLERDGAEQLVETGGRFDRVLNRLERIERRLGLQGA